MKYPSDVINLRIMCRSTTTLAPQRPLAIHMELWYRCREDWFLGVDNIALTQTTMLGMYALAYTLPGTAYSDPTDATQYAEEIRFRCSYSTLAGSFVKDFNFDYAPA